MKIKNVLFLSTIFISSLYSFDKPNGMPPPSGSMEKREPPKEAISACVGKSQDDTCSMYINSEDKEGTCKSLPDKEYLACMPKDMEKMQRSSNENMEFTPINGSKKYVD